jgi:hypothetical protein
VEESKFWDMGQTRLLKFAFIGAILMSRALSMNVDWLPNDENAPLPLSSVFRSSLRKLCNLVDGNSKLPPEILKKKEVIVSMCKKLDEDEANINSAAVGGGLKLSAGLVGFIGIVIFVCTQSEWMMNTVEHVKKLLPRRGGNKRYTAGRRLGHREDDSDRMADDIVRATLESQGVRDGMGAIREARLRALEKKEVVLTPTLPGTENDE